MSQDDLGRSLRDGLSQVEPASAVSPAVAASIPSAGMPKSGHASAQAYIDDPRHAASRLNTRQIMDDHFSRARSDALEIARDCFLNMIADATRFEEEVDGDVDSEGRTQITVDYHLTVGHSQLAELAESLGIKTHWGENVSDAISRAIDDDASAIEARRAETPSGSVHERAVRDSADAQTPGSSS